MFKRGMIFLTIVIIQLLIIGKISAVQDGWEMSIVAMVLEAKNRIVIGQKSDAGDGVDGRYDVPALLSGDITAYIELEGDQYWKDIKKTCGSNTAPCKKIWNIVIESAVQGEIKLKWDILGLPEDMKIVFIDIIGDREIDMEESGQRYIYENSGKREFILEVYRW